MSKKLNLADMSPKKGEAVEAMQPGDTPIRSKSETEVPTTDEHAPIRRTDFQ